MAVALAGALFLTQTTAGLSVLTRVAGVHRVTIVHSPQLGVDQAAAGGEAPDADTTLPDSSITGAVNILLTGSDGRSCIDPGSPYAGAFLADGSATGDRSDTIMVLRIDRSAGQLGLLSLPRDLLVPIAGTGRSDKVTKDKINSAFTQGDPNRLIQTIENDFGIRIDHYVGVDFCAFKTAVDALGGISIPFQYPARDSHTGLNVTSTGCHLMAGDEALAYVRSRYYAYEVNGRWLTDTSSDYGRIARQQDFVRRLATRALAQGAANPVTATRLLGVARSSDIRFDDGLSVSDLIHLASAVRDLGPENTFSYRFDGTETVVNGADVIVPDLTSPTSRAVLAYFRGLPAPAAPGGRGEVAGLTPPADPTANPASDQTSDLASPVNEPVPGNQQGIVPPASVSCP